MWYVACICPPGMQRKYKEIEVWRLSDVRVTCSLEETCIIEVKRKSETPMKTFFLS